MLIKYQSMLKELIRYRETIQSALRPTEELRFINWYLQHGCDLDCFYCRVPKQKIGVMTKDQRREALRKLRSLTSSSAMLSIIGGEPTLRPELLLEAVRDAVEIGYNVGIVTNGWGLSPDLIMQLGEAGLSSMSLSVDCDSDAEKHNLRRALELHHSSKKCGIVPIINTVITRETDPQKFKEFAKCVINNGCFVAALACSPEVPQGAFSNAPLHSIPDKEQLRQIIPWLAWQKITTGRVVVTFAYLWTLFNSGTTEAENPNLWHCSPNFRAPSRKNGRGYLTLDSDGYIGSCQEYPRLLNLLDISSDKLSLQLFDEAFVQTTQKCPGCLYSCYIGEERLHGTGALLETSTMISISNITTNST